MSVSIELATLEDTRRLAAALAEQVPVPMMLALCGPLGAGKTELVRSLSQALGIPSELVTSPTYVLMQRYRGAIDLIHLDYYRLKSAAEAWDLGLDEWLCEPALTVIEWADKFPETWPEEWLRIDLSISASGIRQAVITSQGERATLWSARAKL